MTSNRHETPLELRAVFQHWHEQSGALSALPNAPVDLTETTGPLARMAAACRRVTRRGPARDGRLGRTVTS
jgi:hypothetical protein